MQCTTKYPTNADEIGLEWIKYLKERYKCVIGFSDHSGTIFPGLGAVTLGAGVIEAHITYDRRMFGPDSKASLKICEFKKMVDGIRFLEVARGKGKNKKVNNKTSALRKMFGRSLAINKNLSKGHTISFNDLEVKKPSNVGVPVNNYKKIIGKKLRYSKKAWDFLHDDDLK